MRKKKKTWKDYSYSSLQFRVNKDRKSELEELLSTVVSLKNEKVSQNKNWQLRFKQIKYWTRRNSRGYKRIYS